MIIERYAMFDEKNRTMVVFEKAGKFYGHILKDATAKQHAMIVFETAKFNSLEELKAEYPST